MAIVTPGKRVCPRLQKSKVFGKGAHGKKAGFADLLITPLVDMFIIIVIFLLQNFSATGEILFMSKDITLPDATYGKEIERAPVIQVSNDAVMLEGEQIALVQDLGKDEYWNIPALEEKLRDLKKRYEFIHQGDPSGGFKGDINIQSHVEVQFKTIKRVMYSANQAGYFNINFAVMQAGGPSEGEKKH
ncbi:MAG: ExbD/TolR family protein [Myxococcales bacterium]